jgi:hypothetical protein
LCVKRARLSQNQIQEIVMDSDSDGEKYYASEDAQGPQTQDTETEMW